jgi:hypothetical protein
MSVFVCEICGLIYDKIHRKPISLPCGHVFCLKCLKELKIEVEKSDLFSIGLKENEKCHQYSQEETKHLESYIMCPTDKKLIKLDILNTPCCLQILKNLPEKNNYENEQLKLSFKESKDNTNNNSNFLDIQNNIINIFQENNTDKDKDQLSSVIKKYETYLSIIKQNITNKELNCDNYTENLILKIESFYNKLKEKINLENRSVCEYLQNYKNQFKSYISNLNLKFQTVCGIILKLKSQETKMNFQNFQNFSNELKILENKIISLNEAILTYNDLPIFIDNTFSNYIFGQLCMIQQASTNSVITNLNFNEVIEGTPTRNNHKDNINITFKNSQGGELKIPPNSERQFSNSSNSFFGEYYENIFQENLLNCNPKKLSSHKNLLGVNKITVLNDNEYFSENSTAIKGKKNFFNTFNSPNKQFIFEKTNQKLCEVSQLKKLTKIHNSENNSKIKTKILNTGILLKLKSKLLNFKNYKQKHIKKNLLHELFSKPNITLNYQTNNINITPNKESSESDRNQSYKKVSYTPIIIDKKIKMLNSLSEKTENKFVNRNFNIVNQQNTKKEQKYISNIEKLNFSNHEIKKKNFNLNLNVNMNLQPKNNLYVNNA